MKKTFNLSIPNRFIPLLCATFALIMFSITTSICSGQGSDDRKVSDVTDQEDPYLWLEDVGGEKALNWVRERNLKTVGHFEKDESFGELKDDLLAILDSDERIPAVAKGKEFYYNFWRDKKNVRGLWRRTTLESYKTKNPNWEILLDLDELAKSENENWVWAGAALLRPNRDLALINLSRGGADATVTREFDMQTRQFVENGFQRPEAKGGLQWIDRDHVFVFTGQALETRHRHVGGQDGL
jgi:prolyl oligopeptidase